MFIDKKHKLRRRLKRAITAHKIGLTLSGGIARGIAHIGVLKAFEEYNIPVHVVSGTSIGAIIAALFAAGLSSDELYALAQEINWPKIVSLSYTMRGLVKNDGIKRLIKETIGDLSFRDLKIPCIIATTDFDTGTPYYFTAGPVAPAVQASCTIPVLFAPVEINGHHYVDGGITANLPTTPVHEYGAHFIFAVDVFSGLHNPSIRGNSLISIAARSFMMMMAQLSRTDTTIPDIRIEPDLPELSAFDLTHLDRFYTPGYNAAIAYLSQLL